MEVDSTRPCFYWWGQLPSCPRILLAFHRLAFGLQLDESPTITLRISWGKKDFILKLEPQQGMELPVSLAPRQRMQASKVLSSRQVEESPIELAEPVSPFSGPPEHQVSEAAWLRHWCCCECTEVPPRRIGAHVWDCGTTRISTDVTLLGPQESRLWESKRASVAYTCHRDKVTHAWASDTRARYQGVWKSQGRDQQENLLNRHCPRRVGTRIVNVRIQVTTNT